MALKPWYSIITPREDLIEGKPLDASEFAVHLDHVRTGVAPEDYVNPERFFHRTYLTQNLLDMASQTVRRLSGITTETSPVFNLTTQFGGGKTHALTLLYHLATSGNKAKSFYGVDRILSKAQLETIPKAQTAIFVGTEFSSVTGRAIDGEPLRKTPWGELAFQVDGIKGYNLFKSLDEIYIAPSGDDLGKLFDPKKSYLILFDEVLNYVSKHRHFHDLASQFYNFLHTLTEFVRSRKNIVMAVSIPASELEMNAEDQADYDRFKKMLDRLGKAMFMSGEKETTEIIRRRLFDWQGMPDDARKTIGAHVAWLQNHKAQIPSWFNIDNSLDAFESSFPFHPTVISLFERKWQSLPRFQQTRGILRLLALWVSKAYNEGYKKTLKDSLITLGSAPLEDQIFRAAVYEQLGENRLEAAVTTDITGKKDSHSVRLDNEALETIKKSRLHKKCSTIIFFESNGGQTIDKLATIPEIKLDISDPDLDIGLLDGVIQSLVDTCYYLTPVGSKYKFSTQENLIKRYSDRRASIPLPTINEMIDTEIRKVFDKTFGFEKIIFPEKSNQITDRPLLSLIIIHPSRSLKEKDTLPFIEGLITNAGNSSRTYKSGLIFTVAENDLLIKEEARKYLAWDTINDEADELKLDAEQRKQVRENMSRAKKDLTECIWKTYKTLVFLDKENSLISKDLGLVHSSQAKTLPELFLIRLKADGEISDEINPNFLVRNWPPAFKEWSIKKVRDVFFASPKYPRLLNPDSIKSSISKGVTNGFLAYVGKKGDKYEPFIFGENISPSEIEISDDMFIITAEEAKKHIEPRKLITLKIVPPEATLEPKKSFSFAAKGYDQHNDEIEIEKIKWDATNGKITEKGLLTVGETEGVYKITAKSIDASASATITVSKKENLKDTDKGKEGSKKQIKSDSVKKISWSGDIPPQKWTVFYSKVLSKFASSPNLKITVSFELDDESAITNQKIEETKTALMEMGLDDIIQ